MVSSNSPSFRFVPQGILFGNSAPVLFPNNIEDNIYILGFLNSAVSLSYLTLINPTINVTKTDIGSLPFIDNTVKHNSVELLVKSCINISRLDWDAHETSWDFAENLLVAIMKYAEGEEPVVSKKETGSLKPRNQQFLSEKPADSKRETDSFAAENYCEQGEAEDDQAMVTPLPDRGNDVTKPWYDDYHTAVTALEDMLHPTDGVTTHGSTLELCVNAFEKLWTARFMQLHDNEEELNRQFIDIYGLQDELTPNVPLSEITILQQGEITIE
jgi:hypothetical protein